MADLNEEKKNSVLKVINTVLIFIVGILLTATYATVSEVKSDVRIIKEVQSVQAAEIRVLQAEKEINKTNIGTLHSRVFDLEVKNSEKIKDWVDANYKRKDQK
jgi:hypothetical protein